ncbi:MAG: NACHT domain-containing protein [Frankiaceae bacterium]
MDYDLTGLGPREFEHLVQALCIGLWGPGLTVFGDGPDGGREATMRGPIDWSLASGGERWEGYTVVQAKFRLRPRDPADNLEWLLHQIGIELPRWTDKRYKRAKGELPDNLLIVTNVTLSAAQGGGHDTAHAELARTAQKRGLRLAQSRIWHYEQLRALLDTQPDVRRAYGGFITTGDILGRLAEILGRTDGSWISDALMAHATKELLAKQWVRLGQAGDPEDERVALGSVVIDLPASLSGPVDENDDGKSSRTVNAARFILGRGERAHAHGLQPGQPPHLLCVGNAGQGKSTLAQLVCQVYRLALLQDSDSIGEPAKRVLRALREALDRIDLPLPRQRRWPISVDLSDYGDRLAGGEEVSLLRYISERASARSPHRIQPADLIAWMSSWPWLLVLDGMDEIVTPIVREDVTRAVDDFLVDIAQRNADVLIVVTTRPQGYAGEFGAEEYQRLDLTPLRSAKAFECASQLAAVRHPDDEELREQVLQRFTLAAADPDTSRLLRTPLQVAIMELLLERAQRAPHGRFQLFDAYFNTIYSREQNKAGWLGELLEDRRSDIVAVHERIALLLQQQAQERTDREAAVPLSVLAEVARERFQDEGHGVDEAAQLSERLVKAATLRLVLLVPLLDQEVGFEVRSLREFLAARALTTGPGSRILDRMAAIAPSAHWRNTWLFAAGRVFMDREHLRASLITLLRTIDNDTLLSMLAAPGAELATDLVHDGLAARSPQYQRMLAEHAIERVSSLPDSDWRSLASTLFEAAEADQIVRARLDKEIDRALCAGGGPAATATRLLEVFAMNTGGLAARARLRTGVTRSTPDLGDAGLLSTPSEGLVDRGVARYLQPQAEALGPEQAQLLRPLIDGLKIRLGRVRAEDVPEGEIRAHYVVSRGVAEMDVLDAVLSQLTGAEAFARLVDSIPPEDYQVASALKDAARYWYARRAVVGDLN